MEGLILFVGACLGIGVLGRMATGQSAGEAAKTTLDIFGRTVKTGGKVGRIGWNIFWRR